MEFDFSKTTAFYDLQEVGGVNGYLVRLRVYKHAGQQYVCTLDTDINYIVKLDESTNISPARRRPICLGCG